MQSPETPTNVDSAMESTTHSLVNNMEENTVDHIESEAVRASERSGFWRGSYFRSNDFKELILCIGFFVIASIIQWFPITPHQRPIPFQFLDSSGDFVRNLNNNEEFVGETISSALLIVLAVVVPLVTQFGLSLLAGKPGELHATFCVYLVAFAITLLATEFVKLYAGYLRPIFYEECQPDNEYQECTEDGEDIRKSFPSGHASMSFCGLTLLTLFLHTRFGLASIRKLQQETSVGGDIYWSVGYSKPPTRYRAISVLSLLPVALALFIAASRVVDNKHFPADVVGGAVLGGATAIYCHNLWYK